MKTIIVTILIFFGVSHISEAYDYEDFIRDSQSNPEAVYDHLHPDAKIILKRCAEHLRTDEEFRDNLFFNGVPDLKGKSDKEIWELIWDECNANNYETTKLVDTITIENGDLKLYITEDTMYKAQGRLFDSIIFKKHNDEYLPMIPENIVVALHAETY